jgi:signal-transduction protein with cAMP-binding, CBS, and nucleotidyltransferase domain
MTEEKIQEFINILARCEVFIGLADKDLIKIASLPSIHCKTFEAGEIVSMENQPAENLYILVEGQVELRLNLEGIIEGPNQWMKVDTVSQGSIFGWSALIQPYVYTRMAICSMKSKMLAINGAELMHLMEEDEHIGYEVMHSIACVIASRLRTPNKFFWAELLKARDAIGH